MSAHGSFRHRVRTSSTVASALGMAIFASAAAQAQLGTEVSDPPALQPLEAPSPELVGGSGRDGDEQVLDLNIQYVPGKIFNPATAVYDDVNLRSYTRPGIQPNSRYISPAIHTRPGQTVRVKLHNKLPADSTCNDSRRAQQAALLQRHQPAQPRPVGEPVGQWRQRAAVDRSRGQLRI